jgi:hypothetical protein
MVGSGSGGSLAGSADGANFKFGTVFKKVSQRRKSQVSVEDHFKVRDKVRISRISISPKILAFYSQTTANFCKNLIKTLIF